MDMSEQEGEFYQQLRKLLKQYVFNTGLPYLKLDISVFCCLLSDGLENVTIKIPDQSLKNQKSYNTEVENYLVKVEMNLKYRNELIGIVNISLPTSDFPNSRICEVFEPLPKQIVSLLCRDKLVKESFRILGRSFNWYGVSDNIIRLEKDIDKIAEEDMNVTILGGAGSGKLIAGLSLHIFGQRKYSPFVVTNCADWDCLKYQDIISKLVSNAGGGTIYFRHFEVLSYEMKRRLYQRTSQHKGSNISYKQKKKTAMIFSCASLDEACGSNSNCQLLSSSATIIMPSLTQRMSDIREIATRILSDSCQLNAVILTERAWHYLEKLNWIGGVEQLELVILNLLKKSPKSKMDHALLVHLLPKIDNGLASDIVIRKSMTIQSLAKNIANGEGFDLVGEHPAIQKSVEYIATNYHTNFDIKVLARNSCVSPSHLSFLLRTRLSTCFKQILNLCRIEKSKVLLTRNPMMQVTEISLNLGFCDLSHFEKTFKKQLGQSPKEYRVSQLNVNSENLISITGK